MTSKLNYEIRMESELVRFEVLLLSPLLKG
jgi:hypothetical protein